MPRLTIAFGPSRSPNVQAALRLAYRGGADVMRLESEPYVVSIELADRASLGLAWVIVQKVKGLRSTEIRLDGEPEPAWLVQAMAFCARDWLRAAGACFERFPGRPWSKCFLCPLLDSDRAGVAVPDHVPEAWLG